MEDTMRYTKVPEPHRSLLFRLAEIYRAQAESTSGLIFLDSRGGKELLYRSAPQSDKWHSLPYTRNNLDFLQELDYMTYTSESAPYFRVALKQEALDYYDYMHSPTWRRWISDVWDKTEKYWLALVFGWIGGWCAWLSYYLLWRR
jgi:hypothetical protein